MVDFRFVAGATRVGAGVGADEKARIERLCFSPYVKTFKLKGNKKVSYLNWEVVTCFSNFEIPMFYVIYVMNVP